MTIRYKRNNIYNPNDEAFKASILQHYNQETMEGARKFHQSFPQYHQTPLISLDSFADYLGVGSFYVKDESDRFYIDAFKVLGSSYAIGKIYGEKLYRPIELLSYEEITSDETRKSVGDITLVSATDGNHGRGLAWSAKRFNQKCVIFMPKGTARSRIDNIQHEGAEVQVLDKNYNDCVVHAQNYADYIGGILVQDTAWEGYDTIPLWIMQGYGTLVHECMQQLEAMDQMPTHILLQAGVGSLAAAIAAFFISRYDKIPKMIIIEPDVADCFYQSALNDDGIARASTGDMQSIMAGLSCGEVSTIAWEIIKRYGYSFITCTDSVAAKGVRILSNPLKGDTVIKAGESGAVGCGLLYELMKNEAYRDIQNDLELDKNSSVLMFNTEGITDPNAYRQIVWDGKNSKDEILI